MGDYTEIDAKIVTFNDNAVLLDDGDREVWVPRSLIDYGKPFQKGRTVVIGVAVWFANNKGLI